MNGRKKSEKIIAAALAAAMCISFTGCAETITTRGVDERRGSSSSVSSSSSSDIPEISSSSPWDIKPIEPPAESSSDYSSDISSSSSENFEGTESSSSSSSSASSASSSSSSQKPSSSSSSSSQKTSSSSSSSKQSSSNSSSSKPNGGGTSETGTETTGPAATGNFNYGEALQKSILFYELQRSGDIDESTIRTNWRGDSCVHDGSDVGLDLSGGLYDAGDNVKFNLPMAYTATVLAWSVYEDKIAYEKSGQLKYALDNIKWICDYLIKCHPEPNVYYYQVGDGNADHSFWGAAEVVEAKMKRPSYKVTKSSPGATVVGEAAAALAACAAVYKNIDKSYSELCLKHAKELYNFADTTRSDAGYTAANGFYNSWSGYMDELAWSAVWLYIATGDTSWLNKAKTCEAAISADNRNEKWALCWDNKWIGTVCLLANITGEQKYKNSIESSLDWWSGVNGKNPNASPKGLVCLDGWGNLRYATTMSFVAMSYVDGGKCPAGKKAAYTKFAETQIDYALGSTGRSYVVGFGVNPPQHPHHRTAHGSWADNMDVPSQHRHTLYGALVGGPNQSDSYSDSVSDYVANEVACDYNAGFTGALAKMYLKYGGATIKNFGAVEKVGEEMSVSYRVNAQGTGFTEIKAEIYNKTAWPARVSENLEMRYFVNLSELADPASLKVNFNYNDGAKYGGLYEWDKKNGIYYIKLDFSDAKIYPGGQSQYRKEVQFRMSADGWDPDNDPSYNELKGTNGSSMVTAVNIALYENGKLVFGTEPNGKSAGLVTPTDPPSSSSNPSSSSAQSSSQPPSSSSQAPAVTGNNGKVSFVVSGGNSWQNGSEYCGTGELVVKSTGGSVNSWTITFNVPNGFKIVNAWGANFTVNGTTVTATNVDYTANIADGGSVTAGFQYSCPTKFGGN